MIILGLDPGTATTGFGIIKKIDNEFEILDFGCIETKAKLPLEDRLLQISNDLESLIKKYKPDVAGIEEIFFTNNIKTAISVSHARGVLLYILKKHKVPIKHFTPTEIKSSITGYGKADKHQVQKMIQIILNLSEIPKPDDAADALAIAIASSNNLAVL
ncbi:crossover junction endodeoxyribonuclease RuvC [Candidatus Peregrinibacteria bacterium RIFOXYB2_FULL_32_7]|nr:MAG: crossover junction endodeoxyribonuclease RuvC [Candidatus Peregrinibacteria bacterium RIFOXYB2_FULL_32_7]